MIIDPVAMTFTANGDAFVVEMRDYPYGIDGKGKPGGTIKLLRDKNNDGIADESHTFAENLSFPTSVMAWRSGILVTAPPQILYPEDTNNDFKADVKKVILDGFELGVTDSNLNSLRWGFDGRVHGANGGAGGRVFSPLQPDLKPIKLGGFDFSFDPDTGHWNRTAHTGGGLAWFLINRVMPLRLTTLIISSSVSLGDLIWTTIHHSINLKPLLTFQNTGNLHASFRLPQPKRESITQNRPVTFLRPVEWALLKLDHYQSH